MKDNTKALTYEEFQKLGRKHYNEGGDVIVECWDKSDFDEYCKEFGKITEKKAFDIMCLYEEEEIEAAEFIKWASGEPEGGWNADEGLFDDVGDYYDCEFYEGPDDRYEEKDYGPSNPWDAPGMRVSDFITGVTYF